MKRRLLYALAVVLVLVAGLATAFVLLVAQPRHDETMARVDRLTGLAQEAINRGDNEEADLRTSAAQRSLDEAEYLGTFVTGGWILAGVAALGAVVIVVVLRRRGPAPAAASPAPTSSGEPRPENATMVMTPRPPMPSMPATPLRPQGPPPGWYTDAQGAQRWFDGYQWTPHVR